jgi:hypothetical protein
MKIYLNGTIAFNLQIERLFFKLYLIAFVKENGFEFWQKEINQWILDARWNKSEQLQKIYFNSTGKLISNHLRTRGVNVKLHHFWIRVFD